MMVNSFICAASESVHVLEPWRTGLMVVYIIVLDCFNCIACVDSFLWLYKQLSL